MQVRTFAIVPMCMALCAAAFSAGAQPGSGSVRGPYQDRDGWTVFTPSLGSGTCGGPSANYSGTCIYYVSNAGIDNPANCKGYPPPVVAAPPTTCASLAYAVSQSRTGKPDWVLLKKGDTFFPTKSALHLGARPIRPGADADLCLSDGQEFRAKACHRFQGCGH